MHFLASEQEIILPSLSMSMSPLLMALVASIALASACAVLSVVVVLRRWAFVGEGISHSGFGGAGTAWLLALAFPSLDNEWAPYIAVVVFGIVTALLIARLTRAARPAGPAIGTDAAVGVFLVASLAWGFLAQQIYTQRRHAQPYGFANLLFGHMGDLSPAFAFGAAAISIAVIVVVVLLSKEILSYCFDPLMAQTSGVRTNFIHDLLMVLIAIVIVIGTRVAGSVLVVAMLVLPGVTALLLAREIARVVLVSICVGAMGAIAGVTISAIWPFIPAGPAIVLCLVLQFAIALVVQRAARSAKFIRSEKTPTAAT